MLNIHSKEAQENKILRIGDAKVKYNPLFRLYLTSTSAVPHFLPEVYALVNVVDCTVTPKGLEEQLLSSVVAREAPDIERRRTDLIATTAADRKLLLEIEEDILKLLYQVIRALSRYVVY